MDLKQKRKRRTSNDTLRAFAFWLETLQNRFTPRRMDFDCKPLHGEQSREQTMQVQYKSGAMFFRAVFSAVLVLVFLTGQSWGQSNLTLGHQVLLEKGLQLKTLAMPTVVTDAGGTFDVDLYLASGFNTIDLWSPGVYLRLVILDATYCRRCQCR